MDYLFQFRTDLAVESRELYKEEKQQEIKGVEVEKLDYGTSVDVTRVVIKDDHGSDAMGRPIGEYITLECRALKSADADLKDEVSKVLAKELVKLLPQNLRNTLIVGLGNWDVTPDALGPKVVSKVLVTRHFFKMYNKTEDEDMACVSAISPGVMGVTGIETSDIIKGIVEKSKPDLVIAVDALASRKMERVSTTIQLTTTGISPGSGVGNARNALNEESLGVPVFAIGVPTVVDAATMTNDIISMVIKSVKEEAKADVNIMGALEGMDENEKYALIKEVLDPYGANVIVTTKEIDKTIADISQVIANGLNIAIHPGIDLKDVNRYLN